MERIKFICIAFLICFSSLIAFFFFMCTCYYMYFRCFKKIKPVEKIIKEKLKEPHLLKKIFILFPRQLILDHLTFDPNTFSKYGLHMVCGKQGRGKTMTVVYLLQLWKKFYPMCHVITNMDYKYEDCKLTEWQQLTLNTNGIYGEIDVIDEIQNWFSSNQSKDFPPDFLHIITQQRKVRRCIIGTSQVFTRVAKPLREQTQFLYLPLTLFGCFTICRVYELEFNGNGDVKSKHCVKTFCFVHNKELRESYDSYKVVEDMKSGYKNELIVNQISFEDI